MATTTALTLDRTHGTCLPDWADQIAAAGFTPLDYDAALAATGLHYAHRHTSGRHAAVVYGGPHGSVALGLEWVSPGQESLLAPIPTAAETRARKKAESEARRAEEFEQMIVVNLHPLSVGFDLRVTRTPVHLPRDVRQVVTASRVYEGTRDEIAAELRRGGFVVA